MNRIILIGNGFDLAHGLKTSYKDFITDFLSSKGDEIKKNKGGHVCEFFKIDSSLYSGSLDLKTYDDFKLLFSNNTNKFEIKNRLFWDIIRKESLESWVDIENEYYQKLKVISKRSKSEKPRKQLSSLHKDFKQIENLLTIYLKKAQNKYSLNHKNNRGIENLVSQSISLNDIEQKQLKRFFKQIYNKLKAEDTDRIKSEYLNVFLYDKIEDNYNFEEFCKDVINKNQTNQSIKVIPQNLLFLSFNYTNTHENYIQLKTKPNGANIDVSDIQIHGSLEDDKNPIIFGFGDELDKDYQDIEDLDDNDYLENIKSIKYLETDNYRKMLEFAESDQFQIYILGHSCGNSDRTLLNTLFEHENCISIKPFYHKKENGFDNYSDIVRNISRNFTSKAKMRERVVNKTYTSPIPKHLN